MDMKEKIQKIKEDKKKVTDYIRKNGTINGFKDKDIKFTKPL